MKNNIKITLISAVTAFSMIGAAASTIAWFSTTLGIDMNNNLTGESNGAYFADGDGSKADPFIINKPVHLYNLAWLQYLGYFNNLGDSLGAESGPTYFEIDENLEEPLDMTGWILPPIGTTLYPFIGSFDGNGKIVANLTTINSNNLEDYPKKPYPVRQAGSVSNVNVLGMFGVVGTCNLTLPSGASASVYPSDYSGGAYVDDPTTTNVVEGSKVNNFYIDNGHVKNYQQSTIAGITAGYVNAPLSNVGISSTATNTPSSIDLTQVSAPKVYGGKTNISDFTSVGFCEDKYKTNVSKEYMEIYNPTSYQSTSSFTAEQSGDKEGFGGSIGMDNVFNRLETFRNSSKKTQVRLPQEVTGEFHYFNNGVEDTSKFREITTNAENVTSYEFFDEENPLQGRVVFGQSQANYMWGKRVYSRNYTITNEYHSDDDETCYYLKSGNYYFLGTTTIGRTQTESDKTLLFEDTDRWVYYKYNNKNYYLYASSSTNGTLRTADTKQTYMFKVDGNNLRLFRVSDGRSYDRYVRYSNGFSINDTASGILVQTTDYSTETHVDHQINHYTHGSYLPLNVYTSADEITEATRAKLPSENLVVNGAKLNNTGYIVGGTKDMSDNYGSGVRIASNYSYSDIRRALRGQSSYTATNKSNLQILTRTKDTNGVVFIEDDYNAGVDLTNDLKNLTYAGDTKYSYKNVENGLNLHMYASSRSNLDKQFLANTKLYCMRFNEFNIDINNTITAEKVLLNGEVKTNYVLPESCVDFNLKQKGYINFFGGGYRGETRCNAFFSLYHIERDSSDNIISLKRLSKIYGTNNEKDPYIYEYVGGTYSIYDNETNSYISKTSIPDTYSLHFDLKWVEEPGFTSVDNTVWYFEIPTNPGEYALGSAVNKYGSENGGTIGGYIFYLDVGANAANVYRSTVIELINIIAEEFSRPLGVGIVAGATSVNDVDSYCITIKTDYAGVVSVARASATAATYTESVASESVFLSYAYDLLAVNTDEEPIAISKIEQNTKRLTYFDYTPNDDSTTETILSYVTTTTSSYGVAASGGAETTFGVKQYKNYATENVAEETESVVVYDDEGHIVKDADYSKASFLTGYNDYLPTSVYYQFSAYCDGIGTISADIVLTTNQEETDYYDLYNARGYSITIYLTTNDNTVTDVTENCTFFAYDGNAYVVDSTTGTLLLVINEEFILNDISESTSSS